MSKQEEMEVPPKKTPMKVANPEDLPEGVALVGYQEDWIPQKMDQPAGALTPHALLAKMVSLNPTPETLEQMIALAERWDANQARKAFVAAMSAFKKECPPVLAKTKSADFGKGSAKYKWTPLEDIIEIVTPHLAINGLSARWEEDNSQGIKTVTCIIEHEMGHREKSTFAAPYDKQGGKSDIQSIGSATTYGRRYTILGALGLATADMDDADTAAGKAGRSRSKKAPKEDIRALEQLAKQVGPALAKKAEQVLRLAKRGDSVDLTAVITECEESLEPPK